jgi:NAD(P)-dependent dehydrogenase (short-subunit alcohol dehydrogenase family)
VTSVAPDTPVAIVTGAGSGIGRATAVALAGRRVRVLGIGRRPEALARTAEVARTVESFPADLLDRETPGVVVRRAVDLWDRVDIVVNNAGGIIRADLDTVLAEQVDELFAMHVVAPTLLTQAALPWLRETRGCVVNVSSTFGHRPSPGSAHYGAAKGALEHLTRTWALELAQYGIRVNAVAPGPTETEVLEASGLSPDEVELLKTQQLKRIPLGRRGEATEVADWIVRLALPDSGWVTGQVITVDGGLELL